MVNGLTVKEAKTRLGVSRSKVYWLIDKGRIRVVSRTGQPRDRGRFAAGGCLLHPDDVEREAEARGR